MMRYSKILKVVKRQQDKRLKQQSMKEVDKIAKQAAVTMSSKEAADESVEVR